MTSALYIPKPNDQRLDTKFEWDNVSLIGNVQCMGNGFEDILASLAMEFKIPTLNPGSTYNYYALFYGTLRKHLSRSPKRHHYFNTSFHAIVLNLILEANNIPVRCKRKSTKNVHFALAKLEETERIILLSLNTSVGRHIVRVNAITGDNVNANDPYGKNPYTVDKAGGFKNYSIDEIHKMGVNSVVWLQKI